MYMLKTNDNGQVSVIEHLEKGTTFEPRPNLPEYEQMLKWIEATFKPPLNLRRRFPCDTKIFLDRHALGEYCRRHGILLYATPKGVCTWKDSRHDEIRLCYLSVARSCSTVETPPDFETGISRYDVNFAVPDSELYRINDDLEHDESTIRRVSSLPVYRTFVYLDVSDFSKYKPGQQALIINSLGAIVIDSALWTGNGQPTYRKFEAMLCIGDGYIFVFDDPVYAAYYSAYLAHLIEVLVANDEVPVDFHFRMGAHIGLVYSFWDPGREKWNYVGDGINGGSRVLAAVGKDQDDLVFISSSLRKSIQAAKKSELDTARIVSCLSNRGRKSDKHGNPWRVYEMNHTALCNHDIPEEYRRP